MNIDRYSQGIELFGSMSRNDNGRWVKFEDMQFVLEKITQLEQQLDVADKTLDVVFADSNIKEKAFRNNIEDLLVSISEISKDNNRLFLEKEMWVSRVTIIGALLFLESLVVFYFY